MQTPTPTPTEHDWPEDWPHDNGMYMCTCSTCKAQFIGHKRRLSCKVCHVVAPPVPSASPTCTWQIDSEGLWHAACDPGSPWQFGDGSPSENKARFCMKCGKPLKEVLTPREDNDA